MKKIAYCCAGIVGLLTTEFGVIGILPQLATAYHISIDKAGWLLSAFALIIAVAGPFTTWLAGRFNHKPVLLLSLAPFLLANLVSALAPFWLLLLVRVLPAFLQPVFYATVLGLVAGGSKPNEGPRLMTIMLSGIGIATVTTIPLATYAASTWVWQAAFIVQALVSALALLVVYWGVPAVPPQGRVSYSQQLHILVKPVFLRTRPWLFCWWRAGFAPTATLPITWAKPRA